MKANTTPTKKRETNIIPTQMSLSSNVTVPFRIIKGINGLQLVFQRINDDI